MRQRGGYAADLFIRLRPFLLLDGFADTGDGLDAVTGVEPRGVEQVLEPRAVRQPAVVGEQAFAADQIGVQTVGRVAAGGGTGCVEGLRRVSEIVGGLIEGREIQVRRNRLDR